MIPSRAISAIAATLFGLVLLLSFKTPAAPSLAAGTNADAAVVGDASAPPSPAGTATTDGATEAGDPTTAPTATATGVFADGTYTGDVVRTRFGNVQVEVTISAGVLADVSALQLPSGDRHSVDISDQVEPVLRQAALTAQSADIDLLSGATYTSAAYAESLQAALDAAAA